MGAWTLAVSVLAAGAGLGYLIQGTIRQIIDRMDSQSERLMDHVDQRFSESEGRRAEQTALWAERLSERDRRMDEITSRMQEAQREHPQIRTEIAALARRVDDQREHIAANFVPRETWLEHVGGISIKLDRLKTEIDRLTQAIQRHPTSD